MAIFESFEHTGINDDGTFGEGSDEKRRVVTNGGICIDRNEGTVSIIEPLKDKTVKGTVVSLNKEEWDTFLEVMQGIRSSIIFKK